MPRRTEALQALDAQPGDVVPDLACGGGPNLDPVLARLRGGGLLASLDYTPAMLRQAARRIRRGRWGRVALVRADAGRLPFPDDVFDRAVCTYALRVMPPWREALDEVVRVLNPGGRFVVLDGKPSSGPTRFLNPLAAWIAQGPLADLARPVIDDILQRFANVQVVNYDSGHIFLAVAFKAAAGSC